jgi:hypothetical protein
VRAGLLEVDLPDLERLARPAENGRPGLHPASAAATDLPSVTVETFCSA